MRKRVLAAAALLAAVALTGFLAVPPGASEDSGGLRGELSAEKYGSPEGRTYKIRAEAWGRAENPQAGEPSRTVLCVDVSEEMLWLAEPPRENECFLPGTRYSLRDGPLTGEETDLYAAHGGEYKPVRYRDGAWYTGVKGQGEGLSEEIKVGELRGQGGESWFEFSCEIFRKGRCGTRLERMAQEAAAFLDRMSRANPENQAGIVYSSGEAMELTPLTEESLRRLKASLSGCGVLAGGIAEGSSVLEEAAGMLEALPGTERRNLFVVGLGACGPDAESGRGPADRIKSLGAEVFDIRISGGEAGGFLSAAASSEDHELLCDASGLSGAFDMVYREAAVSSGAEVRLVLDPRFTLAQGERERLESGRRFSCKEQEDSSISLSWQTVLPENGEERWSETILVEAREAFLGGNRIPVLQEGSGVFQGEAEAPFSRPQVNVPVRFHIDSTEETIFLGDEVPITVGEAPVTDRMYLPDASAYCGMEETGSFSYLWLDETGGVIGPSEELGKLRPERDRVFTLKLIFTPFQVGEELPQEAGPPVGPTERTGCYTVYVERQNPTKTGEGPREEGAQ